MVNNAFLSAAMPPSRQKCLRRQRLHDLLEQALEKPALTIIAGAGFGKTQAVFCYLEDAPCTTTWVQFTELDNIPMRFWENIATAIGLHMPTLAADMRLMGFPDTAAKVSMFISLLQDAPVKGTRYVTVFDDFHLIHEKRILLLLESVINAGIPGHHMMLISRTEPQINLTDLRVRDMVFNIGEEALRFSMYELDSYFEMRGIPMSPQAIAKVHDITEGWIFAIRLLELAIRQGAPHETYAIDAMRRSIFMLMEGRFFTDLSREVQLFLVKLSLFQSLPYDLVRKLAAGSDRLIEEALKINAFIRYDSFVNTYCIHHLFLDFLKQRQSMLTPAARRACFLCAADWYALNGYRIDAINYYGQAAEYEQILDIVLALPGSLPAEVAFLLLDILDAADPAALECQPLLVIVRARALTHAGRLPEGMALLTALRARYEAQPLTPKTRSILCEICITQAVISHFNCIFTDALSFLDLFKMACEYMPQGSAVLAGRQINHELGAFVCRVRSVKREDMDSYIQTLTAAIPYITQAIDGHAYGLDDLARAELAYFKNRMKEAESMAYRALCKAREKGQHDIENRALFYLLRVALSMGDFGKIQEILKQLDLKLTAKAPDHRLQYDVVVSWFYSVIGCEDKVAGWLKSSYVKHDMGLLTSGVCNLSTVKFYASAKRYDELLAFLEGDENTASFKCFLMGKIALLVSRAVCLYHLGRQEDAIEQLTQAYAAAGPNGLTMHFIEQGNDMVALSKCALKCAACAIPDDWLRGIQRKASTYAKRISYVASEYRSATRSGSQLRLTRKEQELITDLCHGLSIAEIAANRDISGNYVNNRLQAIYAKLGAQNAKDAIRIAATADLIN